MSDRKLKFAIFGNDYKKQEIILYVERILSYLMKRGAEAQVEPVDLGNPDYVISMGGDGTLLKAAGRVGGQRDTHYRSQHGAAWISGRCFAERDRRDA